MKVNLNNLKTVSANEEIITKYNGQSVRNWAQAVRDLKQDMPKIYYFCASVPVRRKDDGRVLVEGKYKIGCYWKGHPLEFARFVAQFGYKLPCSGTLERCKELVAEYKDALCLRGKYAPKATKSAK